MGGAAAARGPAAARAALRAIAASPSARAAAAAAPLRAPPPVPPSACPGARLFVCVRDGYAHAFPMLLFFLPMGAAHTHMAHACKTLCATLLDLGWMGRQSRCV